MKWSVGVVLLALAGVTAGALLFTPGAAAQSEECFAITSNPVDLFLAFDTTASMNEEIPSVKAEAANLLATLQSEISDIRFAVGSFRDYPGWFNYPGTSAKQYGLAGTDFPWALKQDFTHDAAAANNAIQGLSLGDGMDPPEAYSRALLEGAEANWRGGDTIRLFLVWGDQLPHDNDFDGINNGLDPGRDGKARTSDDIDLQTVIAQMAGNNVKALMVDAGYQGVHPAESWMRYAATQTGGNYLQLNDAAGLANFILGFVDQISESDATPPSTTISVPQPGRLYMDGIDSGAGRFPDRADIFGDANFAAAGNDNCDLESIGLHTTPDAGWADIASFGGVTTAASMTSSPFTASTAAIGNYTLHATATDWVNLQGFDSVPIAVVDGTPRFEHPSPCIAGPGVVFGIQNQPLTFNVQASSDIGPLAISLTLVSAPPDVGFSAVTGNPATGTVSWANPLEGQHNILIQASNGVTPPVNCPVTIDIGNPPPKFDRPPEHGDAICDTAQNVLAGFQGRALSFSATARSPIAGRSLTIGIADAPAGPPAAATTISQSDPGTNPQTALISWLNPIEGAHTFTLVVNDGEGNADTCLVRFDIANPPPAFDEGSPCTQLDVAALVTGTRAVALDFPLSAHHTLPERTVVLSYQSGPAGIVVGNHAPGNPVAATATWANPAAGSHTATFLATDNEGVTATCDVPLDIADPRPYFRPVPDGDPDNRGDSFLCTETFNLGGIAGVPLSYPIGAASPEPSRLVTIGVQTGPDGLTIGAHTAANPVFTTLEWPAPAEGSHAATITATDDLGNAVTCNVTLDIISPPPFFTDPQTGPLLCTSVFAVPGIHGDALAFGVRAASGIQTRTVTISVQSGPAGLVVDGHDAANPVDATVSWQSPVEGDHAVVLLATDNFGKTATCELDLSIANPPPFFTDPQTGPLLCTSVFAVPGIHGDALAFGVRAASGIQTRTVTISVQSGPTGLVVDAHEAANPVDATVSWQLPVEGDHTVVLLATDNFGNTATCELDLSIANPPPEFFDPEVPGVHLCATLNTLSGLQAEALSFGVSARSSITSRTLTMALDDGPAGLTLASHDAANPLTVTGTWDSPLEGVHTANITATDSVGNTITCKITFTIANPPPIFIPGTPCVLGTTVQGIEDVALTFPLNASSPVTSRTVWVVPGADAPAGFTVTGPAAANPWSGQGSWPSPSVGSHAIAVDLKDSAGNVVTCTINVTVIEPMGQAWAQSYWNGVATPTTAVDQSPSTIQRPEGDNSGSFVAGDVDDDIPSGVTGTAAFGSFVDAGGLPVATTANNPADLIRARAMEEFATRDNTAGVATSTATSRIHGLDILAGTVTADLLEITGTATYDLVTDTATTDWTGTILGLTVPGLSEPTDITISKDDVCDLDISTLVISEGCEIHLPTGAVLRFFEETVSEEVDGSHAQLHARLIHYLGPAKPDTTDPGTAVSDNSTVGHEFIISAIDVQAVDSALSGLPMPWLFQHNDAGSGRDAPDTEGGIGIANGAIEGALSEGDMIDRYVVELSENDGFVAGLAPMRRTAATTGFVGVWGLTDPGYDVDEPVRDEEVATDFPLILNIIAPDGTVTQAQNLDDGVLLAEIDPAGSPGEWVLEIVAPQTPPQGTFYSLAALLSTGSAGGAGLPPAGQ